jgi:DNA polymerase-1
MAITKQFVDETVSGEGVKALVELRPWMRYKRFELIDTLDALDTFIDEACERGLCAVDTETSGLNTGPDDRGRDSKVAVLAGICLAYHKDYGVYIPVGHFAGRNLPVSAVIERMKRLLSSCIPIFHNGKYDLEIFRNYGILLEDPKRYRDTLLGAAVLWSDRETKGLKPLVKDLLGKEMIELKEIASGKVHIDFRTIHPKDAVYYAASDAVCTLELYEYEINLLTEWDPNKNNGLHFVWEAEHACQLVVMEMERNLVKVNIDYYRHLANKVETRKVNLEDEIFAAAGQTFEISSNKQLGEILFDKLKLPYPSSEKSKTGDYFVKDEILEKIADKHPLPRLIQEFREMEKIYNTYLLNLIKNVDANSCVKFQMNQTAADSGRFSATGGKGLLMDGYSGVNCQNIPAVKKDDQWKLRYGIVARPGFKIVAIDYSGEELRIATNLSKEPVWTTEFNEGSGDLHSITAALLFNSTPEEMAKPENKGLRAIGKQINFLILYGGGASKLAASAKIPLAEAQERLDKFFVALPHLSDWLKTERIRAKRRGYSLTAFGRRRPLAELYKSGDRGLASKADRLACNAAIQGTGADIIKIALFRVWSYIRKNNLQNDMHILMPIHDEIVYEMREDKLDMLIPAVSEIMKLKDLTKALKWKVGLEVDAEYDSTFMVKKNYFQDLRDYGINAAMRLGMSDEDYNLVVKKVKSGEAKSVKDVFDNMSLNSSENYGENDENIKNSPKNLENNTPKTEQEKLSSTSMPNAIDLGTSQGAAERPALESVPELSQESKLTNSPSEYYTYEVTKTDSLAKAHTDAIWAVLEGIDPICTGIKKRIRLTRSKKVIFVTEKKYSVEGFLALAFNYTI